MDEGMELRPRPFGRYPKKGKALASEFSFGKMSWVVSKRKMFYPEIWGNVHVNATHIFFEWVARNYQAIFPFSMGQTNAVGFMPGASRKSFCRTKITSDRCPARS